MDLVIDDKFKKICKSIIDENKAESEWAEIESGDMFQDDPYNGGYDADEEAFCFSYYHPNGNEYWFQITIKEVNQILGGTLKILTLTEAD